jgi:signal transduction histidine kinase
LEVCRAVGGVVVVDALTCTLVLVLLVGHYGLYRLGLQQIDLAVQRSDFVSAVSHELRTPLTAIRMYGEMLRAIVFGTKFAGGGGRGGHAVNSCRNVDIS